MNEPIPVVRFLNDFLRELEDPSNRYVVEDHYISELKRYISWFEGVYQRKMEAEA